MKRFRKILVATDTRFDDHPIVQEAVAMARYTHAKLKIVDCVPEFPWTVRLSLPDYAHVRELIVEEKQEKLRELAESIRTPAVVVETKVLQGKASLEIIREVIRGEHDLVMRVAKGRISRNPGYFGRTGRVLLRKCPCPVWLVAPGMTPKFENILGCIDATSDNEADMLLNDKIFNLAMSISDYHSGRFSIVHAWEIYGENLFKGRMNDDEFAGVEHDCEAHASRCLDKFMAKHGGSVRDANVHLLKGAPSVVISDFVKANNVDLLVMGTVARSGLAGLLMGNTAEQILNRVECSVLALKPKGFASPVRLN